MSYSIENFNCTDIEEMMDTSLSDRYVGQDVDRSPGGNPEDYQSQCKGCHTGMDSLRGAFAYYDYDVDRAEIVFNKSKVHKKYAHGSDAYEQGYKTADDSWENLWIKGVNKKYGWSKVSTKGKGVRSCGRCSQKLRIYQSASQKDRTRVVYSCEDDEKAKEDISNIAKKFEESNYNLKTLFSVTASTCLRIA